MMMPNGMAPRNMNTMQQPQPNNLTQQIHARLVTSMNQLKPQLGAGWQSTFDVRQRSAHAIQM